MKSITKRPKIASVISYCSLDRAFLPHVVEHARAFSEQILIVLSDRRFCGTKEDHGSLFWQYPDCNFIQYEYTPERLYGTDVCYDPDDLRLGHHWHNTPRLVGSYFLGDDIDWVAFIDADEVIDSVAMNRWLESGALENSCGHRLSAYRYFREPSLRAKEISDTALLMKKACATPQVLLNLKERSGMVSDLKGRRNVLGKDGLPMVHHYSWVRSKENMLSKIKCWGHAQENNYKERIEREMSQPFNGKDFIHGFDYEKVQPFIDPFQTLELPIKDKAMVHHVNPMLIFNLEVYRQYVL